MNNSSRKMFTRVMCVIIALTIVFTSVAGCKRAENEPLVTPTPAPTATPAREPTGGTLVMPMPENAKYNDPMYVNTEEMLNFYSLIFEPLISISDSGELTPALAESWTLDTSEASTWQIRLRQNVVWHNGKPFTASDVLYTYNRLSALIGNNTNAAPAKYFGGLMLPLTEVTDTPAVTDTPIPTDTPTPTDTPEVTPPPAVDTPRPTANAPVYTPTVTDTPAPTPTPQQIKADASYYGYYIKKIESITVTDEHTLSIKMKESGYAGLYALNFPIMCEADNETLSLIGTGAYKLSSVGKKSITLEVNSAWWKTLPIITTVRFEAKADNATALASYEAGQLNFVPTSVVSVGKYYKENETNVLDVVTQGMEMLVFNNTNVALANINMRKAIVYAIDSGRLIANVYMNKLQPCDVPVAPDSWLYDAKSKVYGFDIDQARENLTLAGATDTNGDGVLEFMGHALELKLLVNDTTDNTARKNAAEFIADCLKEIGITVTVDACSYSVSAVQSSSWYLKKLNSGEFDMALVGLNLGRDCDIRTLFGDGAKNFGKAVSTDTLRLAESICSAATESEMRAAAVEFQTAFVNELPFMVLGFRLNSIVYSSDINITSAREPDLLKSIDKWAFFK